MNEDALKGALSTVETFVGGVGSLVADGVARCREKVHQNQKLCLQDKEGMLQLLVRTGGRPSVSHEGLILNSGLSVFRTSISRTWRTS